MSDEIFGDDTSGDDVMFDFEDDLTDDRKAVSLPKAITKTAFQGLTKGSTAGIRAGISNVLPEVGAVAADFISEKDNALQTITDVQDEGSEAFLSIKKTTEKLLPRAKSFIPKRIYDVMSDFATSYEPEVDSAAEVTEEDQRELDIADRLATIFSIKAEQERDLAVTENLETNISRQLDLNMHSSRMSVAKQTAFSLRNIADFSYNQTMAYMKESLYAKWRHIYISKDILSSIKILTGMSEKNLRIISKNTGLPDIQKKRLLESLKETSVGGLSSSISGKVSGYAGRVLSKLKDDALSPGIELMGGIADAGDATNELLEMQDSMRDMGDDDGGLAGMAAGAGAGGIGSLLGRSFISKKLQEIFDTRSLNETVGNIKTKGILGLGDIAERGGLIGTLAASLPGLSEESNILKAKEEVDDGGVRLATVEVIPGLLSRILQEINALRIGEVSELQVYDPKASEFVDASERKQRMVTQIFGDRDIRAERAADAIGTLKAAFLQSKDDDIDIEEFDDLSLDMARVANNMAHSETLLKPKKLIEYNEDPSNVSFYMSKLIDGVENPEEVVNTILQSVTDGTGDILKSTVGIFNNKIINMMNRASHLDLIQKMWDSESGEVMKDLRDTSGKISQKFISESFSDIDKETFAKQTTNRVELLSKEIEGSVANKNKVKHSVRSTALKGAELVMSDDRFESFFLEHIRNSEFKKEAADIIDAVNSDPDILGRDRFKVIRDRIEQVIDAKYPSSPGIKESLGRALDGLKLAPTYIKGAVKRVISPSYAKMISGISEEVLQTSVRDIVNSVLLDQTIPVKDQINAIRSRVTELLSQDIYREDRPRLTREFDVALRKIRLSSYDDEGQLKEHSRNIFDKSDPINVVLDRTQRENEAKLNEEYDNVLSGMSVVVEESIAAINEKLNTAADGIKDRVAQADDKYGVSERVHSIKDVVRNRVDQLKDNVKDSSEAVDESITNAASENELAPEADSFAAVDKLLEDSRNINEQIAELKDKLGIDKLIPAVGSTIKELRGILHVTTEDLEVSDDDKVVDAMEIVQPTSIELPQRLTDFLTTVAKKTEDIKENVIQPAQEQARTRVQSMKDFLSTTVSVEDTGNEIAGFVREIAETVAEHGEPDLTQGEETETAVDHLSSVKDTNEKIVSILSESSDSRGGRELLDSVLQIQKNVMTLSSKEHTLEWKDALKEVHYSSENPIVSGLNEIVHRLNTLNETFTGSEQLTSQDGDGTSPKSKKRGVFGIMQDGFNSVGSIAAAGAKGYASLYGNLIKSSGSAAGSILEGGGNLLGKAGELAGKALPGAFNMYKDVLTGTIGATTTGASKILGSVFGRGGKVEPFVNVYLKDSIDPGNPLLSKRLQKKGVFFEDGSELEASDEITEPIFNTDGEVLVTEEDIDTGLVDVDNNPLGTKSVFDKVTTKGGGTIGKLFGGLKDIGGLLAGKALPAYYKGIFGLGSSLVKGGTDMVSGLFGVRSNKKDLETIVGTRLDAILDIIDTRTETIIESMKKDETKSIFGDTDGDGDVEGSYKDRLGKTKSKSKTSSEVRNAIARKTNITQKKPGIAAKAGILSSIAGGAGYLARSAGRKLGLSDKQSEVAGLAGGGTAMGVAGLGATGVGRKAMTTVGRQLGKTALSIGGRVLATGAATGMGSAAMGGLATAGGALATGAASIAASPVLLAGLAAAGVGAVGYGLYKHLTKDKSIKEGNDLARLMVDQGFMHDGIGWADWDLTEEGEEAIQMSFDKKELEILMKSDKISDEAKEYIQARLDNWEAIIRLRKKSDPNRKISSKVDDITKASDEKIKDREESGEFKGKIKAALKESAIFALGPTAVAAAGIYKYFSRGDEVKNANEFARKMVDSGLLHDGWGWADWSLTEDGKEAVSTTFTIEELKLLIDSDQIDDDAKEFIQAQLDKLELKSAKRLDPKKIKLSNLNKTYVNESGAIDPFKVPVNKDIIGADRVPNSLSFNDPSNTSVYGQATVAANDATIKEQPIVVNTNTDNTELINAIREQTSVMSGKLGNIADNTLEAANKEIKVDVLVPADNGSKNPVPPQVGIHEIDKTTSKVVRTQTLSTMKEAATPPLFS